MTKEQIDWKKKYKEAALDLDKLEKSQNNDQLRLAVSHLTLGLQGQSADLDSELKALRSAMKAETDIGSLKSRRMITNIEKHIRKLDGAREDTTQSVLKAVLSWIFQLKSQIDLDSKESDSLSEFERNAPESVEKLYLLPPLIQNLLTLQVSVLASAKADLTAEHSQLAVDTDLSLIGVELIQLIGVLNLTPEGRQQADELVARIEKGLALGALREVLVSVVELAQLAATTSNEDFENYLINLNTQLVEVQGFLQESHSEQTIAGDAHKQLDQQVRRDVGSISKAVKDSYDLGELKVSVSSQLECIVQAMDEFKRGEEERDERLQARYDALVLHVAEMEEDTGRVKAHMEEERLKARTDALTGLPNRAAYDEYLNNEFNRWKRYRQGFSVAIGDLDLFKRINDTYGHLAGDKVLRLISRVLSKHLRGSDFIARFGGEEFVILMPSTEAEEGAKAMDKLRESVSKSPFNFHGQPVTITMSFGVTQIRESDTKDVLFDRADAALYKAKQEGRNRICIG
ncbi:GGDEF domain-containing protein [Neptunomonas antarctica]|uniref:diguanylate cyclase n=1 Tax=Neptunomonas antarctica TaxID=619304 RepID=A0A1N7IRG8_9GAMM|nr:GGDEF domain-containing protein [Neptunomonas antarctica]SIS39678.1 diguanylate cyclase (GGDEF) domain-containing protein [Neptunomonas antarctica]